MLKSVIQTDDGSPRLLLRVFLGGVMLMHGLQKFGMFGGPGFEGAMNHFMHQMNIPAVFAFLAIMAESVGAVALIIGAFARIAALAIAIEMLVAVCLVHLNAGFFMNWTGQKSGEGFEYHLLAIATALPVILRGAGLWSVDRAWEKAIYRREHHEGVAGTPRESPSFGH